MINSVPTCPSCGETANHVVDHHVCIANQNNKHRITISGSTDNGVLNLNTGTVKESSTSAPINSNPYEIRTYDGRGVDITPEPTPYLKFDNSSLKELRLEIAKNILSARLVGSYKYHGSASGNVPYSDIIEESLEAADKLIKKNEEME